MRIYGGESVQGYYLNIPKHIDAEVNNNADIASIDAAEYIDYLYEKYSLEPIERDTSRNVSLEEQKEWRKHEGYLGGPIQTEVTQLRIGYPIKINSKTEEVFALDWQIMPSHNWELDTIHGYIYYSVMNTPQAVKNEVELLDRVISNKKALIEEKNPILKKKIAEIVEQRKKKISTDTERFNKLIKEIDIPLEIINRDAVKPITLGFKEPIKALIPPQPKVQEEYILDKAKVLTILEIVDNVASNWEAAPAAYNKLVEEELRNIILSSLNSVFAGKATGETFSKKGKSDIHLNIAKGAILIMECKKWAGEKSLQEAVDQLFRYLTWRHNYGVIIIFSNNQSFTNVLTTVKATIQTHQTYKNGFREINTSHFESQHAFPDDVHKTVEIHSLVYNLSS
ncbi:MAG: hypothetical protein AAB553_03130 [Patescibacteria group bacterium]